MKIVVICIFGIESVTAKELRDLGFRDLDVSNGRISFEGDFSDIARCNLNLRTAERVYIEVAGFKAFDFDTLYDGIRQIVWKDMMPSNASIPVRASSIDSRLYSTRDCQSISKKAIADSLCSAYGLQRLEEDGAIYPIEVFIHRDIASICLDTTGTGLHKRGYRLLNVEAPLKETIAAALIGISYWKPGRILLDPFCGSGTFAIEAAQIQQGIPPGINRSFGFEGWSKRYEEILRGLKREAMENIRNEGECVIFGSDISAQNIEISRNHAEMAGVGKFIKFSVKDFRKIEKDHEYGIMIANPPYGLRLSDKSEIIGMYADLGRKMKEFDTWSKYILTDDDNFEKNSGCRASRKRKIYNGTIRCTFYQYFGPSPNNR